MRHERKLVAEITSIGRQHLSEAQNLLGELLARLDGEVATNEARAAEVPTAPRRPKPVTLERRARKRREQQRQAAAATKPEAETSDWPALRQALRARIAERGLNYRQVAAEIECQQGTLRTWLSMSSSGAYQGMTIYGALLLAVLGVFAARQTG